MQRMLLCVTLFVLSLPDGFSQLRFPVKKGYIKERRLSYACRNSPVGEIQMEGQYKMVYACESGWVINIFDIDGDRYMLVKGKYYIGYGPFAKVNVKRMDSIAAGKRLGKIAFEKGTRKYLDLVIMEDEKSNLLVENVFAAYVRKE